MAITILQSGVSVDEATVTLLTDVVAGALSREGRAGGVTLELTTPAAIRTLNRDFRNVDAVTDVLTFPAWEGEAVLAPPDGYLGDIAVCLARAKEQAISYGHSLRRELAFLAVHGVLHLLGYDHMAPDDERKMFSRQDAILNEMGITR